MVLVLEELAVTSNYSFYKINERLPHPWGALLLLGSVETEFLVGRSTPPKFLKSPIGAVALNGKL